MAIGSGGEVYNVTLMINHPNEKLDVITEALGLQPDYKGKQGNLGARQAGRRSQA